MSDVDQFLGRGERNGGASIDANDIGAEPTLRAYVGTYFHTFDSVEDAEAFLFAVEKSVDQYRRFMEEDPE